NVVLSYFINYENTFFVFHGVSSEADYAAYDDLFKTTMSNFARLSDPSKLNKQPDKIFVKEVQRAGSLADALKYYGVGQDKMNELALLNNLELTDRVEAGRMIKVLGK
ncbi:MAG: peptidase M48, partial [Bacteroidales bacterium]|nr:peptidase M48 [Bacteroidales bacterium]